MGMEQIIVAFESPKSCDRVREIVENSGTASCIVCRSAAEVKRTVNKQRVSTVVCGFKLPDESAEDLFADLPSSCAMLMVAVQNLLDLCQTDDIFKLASPVSRGDLTASVRMLLQMGHRLEKFARPQRSGEGVQVRAAETEEGLVWRGLRSVALRTEGHPRRQSGGGAGYGAWYNAAESMVGETGAGRSVCL